MKQQALIDIIAQEVREKLAGESSGHDWWHVYRVWKMSQHIGQKEGADMVVVELAALLHDIADWKRYDGDETVGPAVVREILLTHSVSETVINAIGEIIATMSFKGAGVATDMMTREGKVVQDADRLDAIGAIGIARTFAYGGHKGRLIYDPSHKPTLHQSKEAYLQDDRSTINHFYEKLLLLKERMNTQTAKQLAQKRHQFMEAYLHRFFQEWEGTV